MNDLTGRSWSDEYLGLAPDVRKEIDPHLKEYPVRLGAIAKDLGIKVLLSTLPRGTSGQISQEKYGFVIRVNRHEAKHRQRFTLAHELAHLLLHRDRIVARGGWSENVLLRSGQPLNIEYEANRLASDLVVPPDQLSAAIDDFSEPTPDDFIDILACRFRVSSTTIETKLEKIGETSHAGD